jgi:hypothetical protein
MEWPDDLAGPQGFVSRADMHHLGDAIMTDAPKAAMRNDTEKFPRKNMKERAINSKSSDVNGK